MGLRVCAEPGCPELATSTRCDRHSKLRKAQAQRRRVQPRQAGYDSKWERTRKDYLRLHPLCQWHEGCIAPAVDVHHLDGLGPLGPRGHDFSNLEGLCRRHHAKTTAAESPAGWNAR